MVRLPWLDQHLRWKAAERAVQAATLPGTTTATGAAGSMAGQQRQPTVSHRPPGRVQDRSRSPTARGSVASAGPPPSGVEVDAENPTSDERGREDRTMAELRREATELIAVGALDEDRRRREVADLARREGLGRRIQGILFLIRVTKSLEHTWADIVELVQEVVEDERGGR